MPAQQTLFAGGIDPELSAYAEGVLAEETRFIAAGLVPRMDTRHKAGKYRTFPRGVFVRGDATVAREHTKTPANNFEWSTDTFSTETYAAAILLSQTELNDSDNPALLRNLATKHVVLSLLMKHEVAFASKFFTTGVWGTDKVGNADFTYFNDFTNSDPISVIDAGKRAIQVNGGVTPNTMLVGPDVHRALKRHPTILAIMANNTTRLADEQVLANIFGVERYVVPDVARITSAVGTAVETFDYVFGRNVLLSYMARSAAIDLEPSAARIFYWRGSEANAPGSGITIEEIPRAEEHDVKYEARANWDHKVTSSKLGYFLSGAVEATF